MNPTPQAIAKIQAYVAAMSGGWSNSDAAILAAYNTPTIANPTPQATVLVPYTSSTLLGDLSAASAANVAAFPAIDQLYADIESNNTPRVAATVALLALGERITSAEATTINGVLTATQPDPTWQSQISQAQSDLGRVADEDDIAAARAAV